MANVYEFDFGKAFETFNSITFTIRIVVTDDPIGNRSELLRARRRIHYLKTNLSDMEIEALEKDQAARKRSCFYKPHFRHKKLFAKIRRAIKYMEEKTAVWEVQNC